MMEDMNLLGVEEHVVQDRRMQRAVMTHPSNPILDWKMWMLNKNNDGDDDMAAH